MAFKVVPWECGSCFSIMTLCNTESADWYLKINVNRCIQTSQKFRSHLKILGASRLTQSKFYTKDLQTLGNMIQSWVSRMTWCPGYMKPWCKGPDKWSVFTVQYILSIICIVDILQTYHLVGCVVSNRLTLHGDRWLVLALWRHINCQYDS
jgi:hypothetical protein